MIFTDHTLYSIYRELKNKINALPIGGTIEFEAIDPDISNEFSGTLISVSGQQYIYRPFKVWVDLAEILHCRIMTPLKKENNRIILRFKPLDVARSWHNHSGIDISERYGADSDFSKIYKFEEPYFLNDYLRALREIRVEKGMKLLDLGINRGDEFEVFTRFYNKDSDDIIFSGIDHCSSALEIARKRFSTENFNFIEDDISNIPLMGLADQDILISVGTLQSPDINGKEIFMYIVQNIMKRYSSIILGFPNSRYIDCEVVYGAKTKNYRESNLNLLIKDISFYKRYLQQHKYKVITFGKYYVFLVASR